MSFALVNAEQAWALGFVSPEDPSLSGLDDGLVQMLEGLSDFEVPAYAEKLAYGSFGDARESYPLGADIVGDEYMGFDDEVAAYAEGQPEPDTSDLPVADTPDEQELAAILTQRRQAIQAAIEQREVQTRKVSELDRRIVDELNPQYQAALANGNSEAAVRIGSQIRILNMERAAAVQKALDWARFQATASQLAKNVRAQLALQKLFFALQQEDPQTAAAVAQAYQEIGQVTSAMKAARKRTEQKRVIVTASQRLVEAKQAYMRAQQAMARLRTQLANMLRGRDESRLSPSAAARVNQVRAQLAVKQDELAAAAATYQELASGVRTATAEALVPAGFGGLDEMVPYCTLYTHDGYGPTCMRRREMEFGPDEVGFGDLDDTGDTVGRITGDIATGGAADLSWNERSAPMLMSGIRAVGRKAKALFARTALSDMGSWWEPAAAITTAAVQSTAKELGRREAERKSKEQCRSQCYSIGGPDWARDKAICLAKCETGVAAISPPVPIALPEARGISTTTVFVLAIVAGGLAGGLYLATRSPRRPPVEGLAGWGRRRRRRRRRR